MGGQCGFAPAGVAHEGQGHAIQCDGAGVNHQPVLPAERQRQDLIEVEVFDGRRVGVGGGQGPHHPTVSADQKVGQRGKADQVALRMAMERGPDLARRGVPAMESR